ncbi:flagellar basal-body MS-ring/collar protein FliF [Granulicella arctica]|uniref:Flagellar M-ring protein n=1 Tax=Granulicella arctica TaxID=940613 RepID=A0A7Y9PIF9_9BACT|nr:flagellar basal-body MS-ring/collar protein FliF [Granulicella arctica]NYF80339.1 flagellar M-ring protein FliF [Granulicella arctica]
MAETVQVTEIERKAVPGAQGVPGAGAAQKAVAMTSALRERVMALPPSKRTWLIATVCVIAAGLAAMAWFVQRPDWKVLFSGLESKDVQQVSQELATAGIPYQLSADGAGVEVPAEMLDKARMEVAAKGMPQTGRMGFELFDKPNWVGSEFDERVNYQRALEGELEHTIGTLGAVRSARVHLVLPQPSLFLAQEKMAKASVVLKLKRSAMDPDEADSIRSLVAGAVENLSPDQVTLVDADGRVNLKPKSAGGVEDAEVEQALEAKLVAMLEPLAGRDNVRASVNVSYDQGSEERTDEIYDPTQAAPVSMQKSEQTAGGQSRPSGVPGTASNTPAGSAQGAVAGSTAAAAPGTPPLLQKDSLPVYPQANAQGQSLKEENGTYAVTKHMIHTEQGPGRVRRITAAVLVNDRMVTEGAGKLEHTAWKPRSGEEMHRLEELAQAAVGFDSRRGDQVVMQNVSFSSNQPESRPTPLNKAFEEAKGILRAQPGLLRTVMMGICGLLLVLFVLRPAVRQVTATLSEPMMLTSSDSDLMPQLIAPPAEDKDEESHDASERIEQLMEPRVRVLGPRDAIYDYVAASVRRDAAQSTRLLEAWIGTSGESE